LFSTGRSKRNWVSRAIGIALWWEFQVSQGINLSQWETVIYIGSSRTAWSIGLRKAWDVDFEFFVVFLRHKAVINVESRWAA
jgi:hypothetical protein